MKRLFKIAPLVALISLLPSTAHAPAQRIHALAPVELVADGFEEPVGVVVDEAGAIFVSDRKEGKVTRIAPDGTDTRILRGLKKPMGLALDGEGRLLIAEEGRGRLLRREHSGRLTVLASRMKEPRWIAVAPEDGVVYLTAEGLREDDRDDDEDEDDDEDDDEGHHRGEVILRFADGALRVFADGFKGLEGLAVQGGAVYAVTERLLDERERQETTLVRIPIEPDGDAGRLEVLVRGAFRDPVGLALDRLGAAFFTAERRHGDEDRDQKRLILKWRPDGQLVTFATGLKDPSGLAFGAAGHLLVAERRDDDGRLLRFRAPPAPTLTPLPEFTNQSAPTVQGTTEPRARVDLFVNDAPSSTRTSNAAGVFELSAPLELNAVNTLEVFATTHEGDGLTSPHAEATLTHDGTGPHVEFLVAPPANSFVRQTVDVQAQARATDGGSHVASLALSAGTQPLPATLSPALPASSVTATAPWNTTTFVDGPYTLTATATDRAGNTATATLIVRVDNTPPETEIIGCPSGPINDTQVTFNFRERPLTSTSDLVFSWSLEKPPTTLLPFTAFSAATTATFPDLTDGTYTFRVKARDLAGNEGSPAVCSFTVSLAPTIVGVDPSSGSVGTLVTITGTSLVASPTNVTFNGVPAVVRSMSATTITTTVPIGAATGPLSVTTSRGTASRPFTVTTTQDFALQVTPADGHVLQGAATTYTIELVNVGVTPFTGVAILAVEGLPPGVAPTFGSPTLTGGQRGTLTLAASGTAAVAASSFTLRATAPGETGTLDRSARANLTVLAGGRTALVGQVTFVDGRPIEGVKLMLEPLVVFTDAGGNFEILDPPAGIQMLGIDANVAQPGLPIYGVDVTLTAGQVTQLPPFRITPPPAPERFTPIDNAAADQVITDSRFPGVSITLPAGVVIVGWDGTHKNQIAIERLIPEQLPVPPPPGATRSLYQIFFGTPMGGLPSAPLPVTLPNDQEAAPGEQVEIWYYDAAPFAGVPAGWRLAGLGTVSEDGTRIVSNAGVGLERFCGVCGLFCLIRQQGGQPNQNPDGPEEGDPVNLGLGQIIVDKTDLVLPGRLPVVIHRSYNPLEPFGAIGGFELGLGPGWALSIDVVLQEETPTLRRLIWPGNARFAFVRQPDGSFVNTTHVRFAGAVLTQTGGTYRLRLKDGTAWQFNRVPLIFGLFMLGEQADRNSNRLTIERDFRGRPTRILEPGGRALTFRSDSGRIAEVSDPAGRTVRYGYTSTFPVRLERVTDPAGGVTRYAYAPDGRLLTITDPRGLTYLSHEYDAQRRLIRQTQADGSVWTFAYEGPVGAHTRVTVTDPRGNRTIHRMENGGFAAETIDALGQVTRFDRDSFGQVVAATDTLGRVTRFEYDAFGNVTRITDPVGHVRRFVYEPTFNRLSSMTDPLDQVFRFEYDVKGNLTATVDPLGNRMSTAYDGFGQRTRSTDPLGNTTRFEYDAMGNLVATIDPLGNTARREYDIVGRLVRQLDPRGRPTTFAYDAMTRLTRVTDPARGMTEFTYDASGNLLAVVDARGHALIHTYDAMDRLATRTDQVGAVERFEYDTMGNLLRHTDRKGQVSTFVYDALNRRVAGSYADGGTTSFTYDAVGRLLRATDSDGGTILNDYDALDRLLAQTTGLGTVGYEYDALGRRTRMDAPGQARVSYDHDAASRLTGIAQGSQVIELGYDALGRRTRLTLPNQVSTEYGYDAASRLIALTFRNALGVLGNITYGYDAAGNRTRIGGTFARSLLPDVVSVATYDAANRQLLLGDRSMTFDANGNLTALGDATGLTTFTWDARNRLTTVTGPGVEASFRYDAIGRRVAQEVNGTQTQYLYDGLDVLQELNGVLVVPYLSSLFVDEALVRNGNEFYLGDALGSTVALTDTAAAIVASATYDPFGQTAVAGSASANRFLYTGRELDATGLYHYRARYYSPSLHRFVSEDPLGLAGHQINLYRYVSNNPVKLTDPTGLCVPLTPDVLVDVGFLLYDLYRLFADGRKGLGANLAALGADVAGACIPGATGLGLGARAGVKGASRAQDALSAAKKMTPDQKALKELVDEATNTGKKPLSVEDANTVLDWAKESNYPGWRAKPGDVASPSNWDANPVPHIHLPGAGRKGHVPVQPGVTPRP